MKKRTQLLFFLALGILLSGALAIKINDVLEARAATRLNGHTPIVGKKYGKASARVPILIYHNIRERSASDTTGDWLFVVPPADFDKQMKYLHDSGYHPISVAFLSEYLSGQADREMPSRPIVISFDDDHLNQYEFALPILEKYNLTATFYIYTAAVGRKKFMNWDQIKSLADRGMEIASHGISHPYLDRMIWTTQLEQEITDSKWKIEEKIGQPVKVFAYPFGTHNDRVEKIIRDSGYLSARGIANGQVQTRDRLYNLRGYFVDADWPRFLRIMTGKI